MSPRHLPVRLLAALPASALIRQQAELTLLPAVNDEGRAADLAAVERALAHRQREDRGLIGTPRPGRTLALAVRRAKVSRSISTHFRPLR